MKMKTEDFIAGLTADTRAVPSHALIRRLLRAVLVGSAVSLAAVLLLFGLRPDLVAALLTVPFWTKALFTGGIAVFGMIAVERAARPTPRISARVGLLAVPFLFVIAMAATEIAHTPAPERIPAWLGQTAGSCPFSIVGLALPPLALLLLALRRLAPAQPAVAGFAAGLLAGGLAATAYGLHCPETSAAFVATWYAMGILGSGAIGAAAGKRLLSW